MIRQLAARRAALMASYCSDALPGDHMSSISVTAAAKASAWLEDAATAGGIYDEDLGLTAYYKSPLAFALAGNRRDGVRLLDLAVERFRSNVGHFEDRRGGRSSRHCDLYEDLWLTVGATALDRTRVAERTFGYVEQYFDSESGGLSSAVSAPPSARTFDLRSTALGGLVAIELGATRLARSAATFAVELMYAQPEPDKEMFIVRNGDGDLIREFDEDSARYYVIRADQTRPLYYALGLAVCLLARYAGLTGDPAFLVAARRYVEASLAISPGALRHDYSGKLGWGLALLSRLTGEARYLWLSRCVARYLCGRQCGDGSWLSGGGGLDRRERSIDMTAEYSIWLRLIDY